MQNKFLCMQRAGCYAQDLKKGEVVKGAYHFCEIFWPVLSLHPPNTPTSSQINKEQDLYSYWSADLSAGSRKPPDVYIYIYSLPQLSLYLYNTLYCRNAAIKTILNENKINRWKGRQIENTGIHCKVVYVSEHVSGHTRMLFRTCVCGCFIEG